MGDIINIYIIINGIRGDNERWLATDKPPYRWAKDEGVSSRNISEMERLLSKVQKIYPFAKIKKLVSCQIRRAKV